MQTSDVMPSGPEQLSQPPQTATARPPRRGAQLLLCAGIIFCSVASYLIISHFVLMSVEIRGISMSPTLLNGERYILLRCPYLWRTPRLGEIVVIKDPEDQDLSIKRIIGLPNDVVEIRRDGVYVNDRRIDEPYLTSFASRANAELPVKPTRLGSDDYFVLGDNRGRSVDSRRYGPVSRKAILGLIAKTN